MIESLTAASSGGLALAIFNSGTFHQAQQSKGAR